MFFGHCMLFKTKTIFHSSLVFMKHQFHEKSDELTFYDRFLFSSLGCIASVFERITPFGVSHSAFLFPLRPPRRGRERENGLTEATGRGHRGRQAVKDTHCERGE